jgi:hypothetical protein
VHRDAKTSSMCHKATGVYFLVSSMQHDTYVHIFITFPLPSAMAWLEESVHTLLRSNLCMCLHRLHVS